MKIKIFKFKDDEFMQVYLNKEESDNPIILKEINDIKKQNSNIAIFLNGTNETVKTIREMLNYEKNSSNGLNYR
ncbi:MAG: hypothetical protein J6A89_06255 [Clostridia bacterium]|nr:hypothetical protein [Clostridia bacterium]